MFSNLVNISPRYLWKRCCVTKQSSTESDDSYKNEKEKEKLACNGADTLPGDNDSSNLLNGDADVATKNIEDVGQNGDAIELTKITSTADEKSSDKDGDDCKDGDSSVQKHTEVQPNQSAQDSAQEKTKDKTSPAKDEKEKKSGTAYAYQDETSSDSDEEAIKKFQISLQRSGSVHSKSLRGSIKSSRKSPKSDVSDGSSIQKKARQKKRHVSYSDKTFSSGDSEPDTLLTGKRSGSSQDLLGPEDLTPAAPPVTPTIEGPPHSLAMQQKITFDNQAFREISPTDSAAQSEITWSVSESKSNEESPTKSKSENLFDVSDLQLDPPLISKCGSLEVTFKYNKIKSKLTVTILQAREIPSKERGGANSSQVRLLLLPSKKQRHKTKVKTGENPVFEETFIFTKLSQEDMAGMGLRVRLYGLERMRRERMIGESVIRFTSLNLDDEQTFWVVLEPRSNLSMSDSKTDISSISRSDSASSVQSMQHGGMPELLIGLAYNGSTGRLSIEAIKGSNFRNMATNRAPDTYVKLTLMSPSGQEVARSKTSVRRGQPNPLFKETFVFQVALFQLADVTLLVSVYNKRSMKKKEMIGWFALGLNSSGEEEQSHWNDMRENKGEQVCRWHVLLES